MVVERRTSSESFAEQAEVTALTVQLRPFSPDQLTECGNSHSCNFNAFYEYEGDNCLWVTYC